MSTLERDEPVKQTAKDVNDREMNRGATEYLFFVFSFRTLSQQPWKAAQGSHGLSSCSWLVNIKANRYRQCCHEFKTRSSPRLIFMYFGTSGKTVLRKAFQQIAYRFRTAPPRRRASPVRCDKPCGNTRPMLGHIFGEILERQSLKRVVIARFSCLDRRRLLEPSRSAGYPNSNPKPLLEEPACTLDIASCSANGCGEQQRVTCTVFSV